MFKIGDKLRAKRTSYSITKNKIYTITQNDDKAIWAIWDHGHEGYYRASLFNEYFEFVKQEPKTEIDYLNAFQFNFKEGV
jgi:hypothetical protein